MNVNDALSKLGDEVADLVPDELEWTLVLTMPGEKTAGTILTSMTEPNEAISRLELVLDVLKRAERMRSGAKAELH